MNCYEITARIYGEVKKEDPNCPSYWRGSGVYDITSATWVNVELVVGAETEERARALVEDADWGQNWCWEYERIEIKSCSLISDEWEDGECIEIMDENWCEDDYYDDYDEDAYYERRGL